MSTYLYTSPFENTFNLNKLLLDEKLNCKFRTNSNKKYLSKDYDNEEVSLYNNQNLSNSFNLNYFTMQKEMKRINVFNPVSNTNWEKDEKMGNIYFGAFINNMKDTCTNKAVEEYNIIRCKIPQLNLISKEVEKTDNLYEDDLNKYLNNYSSHNNESGHSDDPQEGEKNHLIKEENKLPFHELFFNYSNFEKYFVNFKKVSQIFLEKKTNSNSILNHKYKNNKTEINYLPYLLEETLLLNPFKIINYEINLQKCFANLIYKLDQPVDPHEFFPLLIYLIQGIPSKLFYFNPNFLSFQITDLNFRFLSTIPKLSKIILSFFIYFGNKMHLIGVLIEYYLYNNDKTPFIIKKFYSQINLIVIKMNENILTIKNDLITNKINLIGLYNKLQNFSGILNMIYHIFNLHLAVQKYSDNYLDFVSGPEIINNNKNLLKFLSFYEEFNYNLKSHRLCNSLFNFFNSFNHNKSKNYSIIKNTLLSILKSYLHFIIYLIFNNELIDQSNEYFIIKSNDNSNSPVLDNSKVPFFLQDYKSIFIHNTILLKFIQKYDNNYFSVANYKINDILYYIEKFNFNENSDKIQKIQNFIEFKDKIFNKKLELMYTVNENIMNNNELIINEEKIKKINHLRVLKDFMSLKDAYNKIEKEKELDKKRKYLEEIQNQILSKKIMIEEDIKRIKEENMEEMSKQRENENMRQEIIRKLKEKYKNIIEDTKKIENNRIRAYNNDTTLINENSSNDKLKNWKSKIIENNSNRFELFDKIMNVNKIEDAFPIKDLNKKSENYRYNKNNINNYQNSHLENENLSSVIPQISETLSAISINNNIIIPHVQKEEKSGQQNNLFVNLPSLHNDNINDNNTTQYPNFFIKNLIFNNILTPLIETAAEIGIAKQNIKYSKMQIIPSFYNKSNVEVDSEVEELLNKMKVIIQEEDNSYGNNGLKNQENDIQSKIEIPNGVILQEFFYDLIMKQYKIVNNSFTLMIKNKFNLKSHFEFLNKIYLCYDGDINNNLIDSCVDFKILTLVSNEEEYLNEKIYNEIYSKYSISNPKICENMKFLKFSRINKLNLRYSITNLEMAFKLNYECPEPLNYIFNSKIIEHYDNIFKILFKFNIFQNISIKIFAVLKNQKLNKEIIFNKISKILFKCSNLLKSFHSFFINEILNKNWIKMMIYIDEAMDVFVMIESQKLFLNKIIDILKNKFFGVINKLHMKIAKFYLKAITGDLDYFDYDNLKNDLEFMTNIEKINSTCDNLKLLINDEQIIGDFHNLKFYL